MEVATHQGAARPRTMKRKPVAVSTFSGAGGSSLGLKQAGFEVVSAVEYLQASADTYQLNAPKTKMIVGDIREITAADLFDGDDLDLFEGSPPCSPFSHSGKGAKNWGQVNEYRGGAQRSDDLYDEWLRLLGELRPKAFISENVPALAQGAAVGYCKRIIQTMERLGYRVQVRVLDSAYFGLPQKRRRLLFQGWRDDLGLEPVWPEPNAKAMTLGDAMPWLLTGEASPLHDYDNNAGNVELGEYGHWYWRQMEQGTSGDDLTEGHSFNLRKPSPLKPCETVVSKQHAHGGTGLLHPTEPRTFTEAEFRVITGFPSSFRFSCSAKEAIQQMGRSVPPPLYKAVGRVMRKQFDSLETDRNG